MTPTEAAVRSSVTAWRGKRPDPILSSVAAVRVLKYTELVAALNASCAVLAFGVEPL